MFALLALNTSATMASSEEPARHLRTENSDDKLDVPTARKLMFKRAIPLFKTAGKEMVHQVKNQPAVTDSISKYLKMYQHSQRQK